MEVDSKDNAAPVAVAAVESTCSQCLLENLPHLQIGKARLSLQSIRNNPEKWYRNATFDQRDLELISAPPVFWLLYDQSSFVRKIYHCKADERFGTTEWTVETDSKCKKMIATAGGQTVGFAYETTTPCPWISMTVNVNVTGTASAHFPWGFLSTRPRNIRIFKGPAETCPTHPWDAMILRDCTTNTGTLNSIEYIASKRWDILAMKMCEDFDSSWAVVAIKEAGDFVPDPNASCFSL